jgi:predicted ATPase/class 3 adenylate cyclase
MRRAEPVRKPKTVALGGERRQLTLVFIDIVDSTSLSEKVDPEEFFEILRAYRTICDRTVRKFGGYTARMVGDGLVAYFGFPHAHEDDAERAVRAALSITAELRGREFATWHIGPVRLQLRVAVNTGVVIVGSLTGRPLLQDQEVFGTPAHMAARLQAIAPHNAVIVGPVTHELTRGVFRYTAMGKQSLRGVSALVPYWRAEGLAYRESRFAQTRSARRLPMVGRAHEQATLLDLWSRACAGSGAIVAISGEAGIGKSRLVQTMRGEVLEPAHEILHFQCSALQINTPLAPFVDRHRRAAGLHENDSPAQMITKLRRMLARASSDAEAALPYYAALLSVPPTDGYKPAELGTAAQRERALDSVVSITLSLARQRPILLIVEDVQWIDPTSIELLERLLPQVVEERILLIVTFRADYDPYWLIGLNAHVLPLTKLATAECERIIENVPRGKSLPRSIRRTITERTDGIPLFVEEFTRSVLDSGMFGRDSDRQASRQKLSKLQVPASIQDSLMARLDRLGTAKRVVQVASILGRHFDYDALRNIVDLPEDELDQALHNLESAGLLYRQQGAATALFGFKHALIQETAYTSLLKDTRTKLHAREAARLQQFVSNTDSGQLALLGYHCSRAGMLEEAVAASLDAGKMALARSAIKEAISNLWIGVDLVSQLPASRQRYQAEITLQSTLAMAYTALEGWAGPQVDRPYNRALELCRSYGTVREKSIVLWGVTVAKVVSTELPRALELATEFIELAEQWRDPEALLMAQTAALLANFFLGNLHEALRSSRNVLQQYDAQAHSKLVETYQHDPKIVALVYAGHIHWLLGDPQECRSCCEIARQLARDLRHPFMLAFALILGTADHLYEGELEASLKSVEEGIEVAKQHTLGMYGVFGPLWAIPALVARDPGATTLKSLSELIETLLHYRCYLQAPLYQIFLATELGRLGQVEKALTLARAAEALMRQTGERWFEPEIYRVLALLSAQAPEPASDEAQRLFMRALGHRSEDARLGTACRNQLCAVSANP